MKPILGIRPIIDGRRNGIRESLEEQTMWMAQQAAALISSTLCYPDGSPVECLVAETTIGRAGESADCKERFTAANVCSELTVTPCWDYVTEVLDLDPRIPHAVWGFNGSERPGAVTLAAAMSAYAQLGVPAFAIYGHDVQDADDRSIPEEIAQRILSFARASLVLGLLRNSNYLQIGAQCMGIAGSMVDHRFFHDYLGLGVESVDEVEIERRIRLAIYDPDEYAVAREWIRTCLHEGDDIANGPEKALDEAEREAQWDYSTKMVLIARDLMQGNPRLAELGFAEEASGHNAIVAGFQGQRQWTDFLPNGDVMETLLNTTFDWNGARQPLTMATENDTLNGATMLLSQLLTNRTQMFSDVRTYWSPSAVERVTGERPTGHGEEGFLDLRNSGATTLDATGAMTDDQGNPCMKEWWNVGPEDIEAALGTSTFHPSNKSYFRGGGFSVHFATRGGMPMTMARLNLVAGRGPVLQIAEGWSVELSEKATRIIEERTDPAWPTTFFAPRLSGHGAFRSVYSVMDNWGANHGAIGFGHFGADLIVLASMLRIPVAMHNIDPDDVMRPRVWSLFGTEEPESADYSACATYGPFFA